MMTMLNGCGGGCDRAAPVAHVRVWHVSDVPILPTNVGYQG